MARNIPRSFISFLYKKDIFCHFVSLWVKRLFPVEGIIRHFPKIVELFWGNSIQSWQMAWSDVFCLKIAMLANPRPSKLIRLSAGTCTEQISSVKYLKIWCRAYLPMLLYGVSAVIWPWCLVSIRSWRRVKIEDICWIHWMSVLKFLLL